MWRWLPIFWCISGTLLAAEEKLGIQSPLGTESLLQTVGGLLLILGLILGGAWAFKRYGHLPVGGKGVIKVLGGVSVGARERVVLIEVENVRLLLGVAPGHVRTLHRLPLDERSFRHALNLAEETRKPEEGGKSVSAEAAQKPAEEAQQ